MSTGSSSARARNDEPAGPADPLDTVVFDAHTHLDAMAQRAGRHPDAGFVTSVMREAQDVGVGAVITVGDTIESSTWCVDAARRHPHVYAAVAVHPTEIGTLDDTGYERLEALARDPRVVAVGETGLDYFWDRTDPAAQREHFRRHIALAKAVDKPLMIHDRDAHADVLAILRAEGPPSRVIFHAFSGDVDMARECVDAGYLLSFAGVLTFKNAPGLRAAARVVPVDQMLVETDAPFLTPHPWRGRANAPRLLPLTLRALAAEVDVSPEQLSDAIRRTGRRVFGIELPTRPTT